MSQENNLELKLKGYYFGMQPSEVNPVARLIFLSVSGVILLIIPQFSDPINFPKLLFLMGFTFSSLILFFALRRTISLTSVNVFSRVGFWLYTLLLVGVIISGVLNSKNVIRVFFGTNGRNNGILYFVCVITLSILILRIGIKVRDLQYFSNTLSWTSVVFTFYCLIQYFDLDPILWVNQYNRILGFLGNPNFSATTLAIFSIFWTYKFAKLTLGASLIFKMQHLMSLFMACLTGFLSYATDSLQGPVILCVGFLLIVFNVLNTKLTTNWLPITFFILIPIVVGSVFLSFLGLGPWGSSLEQYTLKLRGWYAYFGFKAMLDNPWKGVGVDNYIYAFRKYRTEDFIEQYGDALSSNNAHSIPIQMGATFGLPVFILFCLLQILVLYKSLTILMSNKSNFTDLKIVSILWIVSFLQTLLSIEIVGLGVLHWVTGAIILIGTADTEQVIEPRIKSKNTNKLVISPLPEWVGALTITLLVVGFIPAYVLFREDSAFKILSQIEVVSSGEKEISKQNFKKLTSFTLHDPAKFNAILPNLYASDLGLEAANAIKRLYQVEPNDTYVSDLLASLYHNSEQYGKEIEIRERIRRLNPFDIRLEGILARAYFDAGQKFKLRESVERLKNLAPDGQEYGQSVALLVDLEKRQNP